MFKFYTKSFTDPDKIDKWLNGFEREPEVVGYAFVGNGFVSLNADSAIIITVKVLDSQKVDLTKMPKRVKE